MGGSWAENRRKAYEMSTTPEPDEEAYETDETDVTPEPEDATSFAKIAELWKRAVGWVAEKDMVAGRGRRRRLTTIEKMQAHLTELKAFKTLTAGQTRALQEWKARREDAKKAGHDLPLFQKDGPYDAAYYLAVLDDLCFEGELRSWVNLSWTDSLNPREQARTSYESGDGGNYAHIELSTTLLEASDKFVILKLLQTMAHEAIHTIESLPPLQESPAGEVNLTIMVHGFGLTRHGPSFRRVGQNVQRFLALMLHLPAFDLDVRALGTSHKRELDALISLDPSDIPDLDEWNFAELEGKPAFPCFWQACELTYVGLNEEVDPAAQPIDELRYDIRRQWDLKAAARSAAPTTGQHT